MFTLAINIFRVIVHTIDRLNKINRSHLLDSWKIYCERMQKLCVHRMRFSINCPSETLRRLVDRGVVELYINHFQNTPKIVLKSYLINQRPCRNTSPKVHTDLSPDA